MAAGQKFTVYYKISEQMEFSQTPTHHLSTGKWRHKKYSWSNLKCFLNLIHVPQHAQLNTRIHLQVSTLTCKNTYILSPLHTFNTNIHIQTATVTFKHQPSPNTSLNIHRHSPQTPSLIPTNTYHQTPCSRHATPTTKHHPQYIPTHTTKHQP